MQRLLLDGRRPTRSPDLTRDLALDSLGGEGERVHVLQLGASAKLVGARRTDRDVDVEAHRALVELGVGEPELDHRLPQQLQEALRRVGVVEVGLGDDLDERGAAAVEVDERRGRAVDAAGLADVHRLRGVLLEVRAHDPDLDVAVRHRHA